MPISAVLPLRTERSDMRRSFQIFVVAVSLLFLLALGALAQFQSGNIYGTVKAKDGSLLPGVTVTLTGGGAPRTFVTDASGRSRFRRLSARSYWGTAAVKGRDAEDR